MFEELQTFHVEVVAEGYRLVADPFGEGWLEVWEAGFVLDAGPVGFGGCTKEPGELA